MSKTPISILQEIMVAQNKPLPVYEFVFSGSLIGVICKVQFAGKEAEAKARNKKIAKQEAASNALKMLDETIQEVTITSNDNADSPNSDDEQIINDGRNYIGLLLEFCAKNKIGGVEFLESMVDHKDGQFRIVCVKDDIETTGKGLQKKIAKQNAACKMYFKLMENPDILIKSKQPINVPLNADIIAKYKDIILKESKPKLKLPNVDQVDSTSQVNLKIDIKKKSKIDVIRRNPYIVTLKYQDTECVIMGTGETEQIAIDDASEQMLKILNSN